MNRIIDRRKIIAIDKLIEGKLTRKDIAKFVGIGRNTLYDWMKDENFVAEWDRRVQQLKGFAEKKVEAGVDFYMDNLLTLAADDSNKRVQAQVNQYLMDRALGRPTTKVDVEAGLKATPTGVDVLQGEFAEFDSGE